MQLCVRYSRLARQAPNFVGVCVREVVPRIETARGKRLKAKAPPRFGADVLASAKPARGHYANQDQPEITQSGVHIGNQIAEAEEA